MTIIILQDRSPTDQLLADIETYRRDAKKYGQTALYDLLSAAADHIKKQEKALSDSGKEIKENFTYTAADAAFSDYIRARAGYKCERCGTQYPAKSNGLQCSHHFSRRHYSIRYDPDNAAALCHNCHNYWYSKDIPEAARWLEQKIGRRRVNRLIKLKNGENRQPAKSEEEQIAIYWRAQTEALCATADKG